MGGTTELCDVGMQTLPDGSKIPLPPVILGVLGNDPKKNTICMYGHLDVQPALKVRQPSTTSGIQPCRMLPAKFRLLSVTSFVENKRHADDVGPKQLHCFKRSWEEGVGKTLTIKYVMFVV